MGLNWKAILPGLFGALATVGGEAANGKIAALNSAAQTAVKAAVTKTDNGIDKLVAAYNKFEASNEIATEAVNGTIGILKGLGLTVPSVDVVQIHVKAAIADLAGILVPVSASAVTTDSTAATPVPAAATSTPAVPAA